MTRYAGGSGPRGDATSVVAFGGGHGLGATLRALRRCATTQALDISAVVTVGDDGGSSGRLRQLRGALPPGDLRQALAALAADDPYSSGTAALFQHRFAAVASGDPLAGHAVGNLVLCGLMELLGDPVAALDQAAAMVHAGGRVLPMSCEPVAIEADVRGADPGRPDEVVTVRGQHQVAVSQGQVRRLRLHPATPTACKEVLAAVAAADWLVFGPGSWYTSVIPHLLVPELAAAVLASPARRLVVLNLTTEPETAGLTVPEHLTALSAYAPGLWVDVVLGDSARVGDPAPVRHAAWSLGARLVLAPVTATGVHHDPDALAAALRPVLASARPAGPSARPPAVPPAVPPAGPLAGPPAGASGGPGPPEPPAGAAR